MKTGAIVALLLTVIAAMPARSADSVLTEADEKCLRCHDEEYAQYAGGIHASLRRQGYSRAPVCTDCHITHRKRGHPPYQSETGAPCSNCHEAIFAAYATSVHSQVSISGDEDEDEDAHVLGCPDCHQAHDITATASGDRLKESCLACHENVLLAHQEWLPNAALHFEAVACPACHAPKARRKVDLKLYNATTQQRIREKEGVPQFEDRIRAVNLEGRGLDALALQSLLREFNRDEGIGKTILRGRLEVRTGAEAHQLADKGKAIRDCERCHSRDSEPFQSVTISIARPDGRALRHDAHKGVLNSTVSIESVKGFYAIGATRIKFLDTLFLLSLAGGITVPIGHMTIRRLAGKYLKRRGGHPQPQTPPDSGDRPDPL